MHPSDFVGGKVPNKTQHFPASFGTKGSYMTWFKPMRYEQKLLRLLSEDFPKREANSTSKQANPVYI